MTTDLIQSAEEFNFSEETFGYSTSYQIDEEFHCFISSIIDQSVDYSMAYQLLSEQLAAFQKQQEIILDNTTTLSIYNHMANLLSSGQHAIVNETTKH